MNTRACWHLTGGQSLIREEPLPPLEEGKCQVDALFSLISTGTERLIALGQVPRELFPQMKVPYMGGDFSFPIKYGYSLVGTVTTDNHPYAGKTVHLLHPHQSSCIVASQDLFVVPDEIPAKRAILASNLETALNAVWDAQISIGDKVLVIGFGIIGSLVARVLSMIGAVEVVVQDIDLRRRNLAEQMGFWTQDIGTEGISFDAVFHTSASESGLQAAIDQVGFEGKIIELSWYGNKSVSIQLGGDFHSQRKQIISSQVSHLPPYHSRRWNYRRRKEVVFELLKQPAFDAHLTAETRFEDLPKVFSTLREGTNKELAWVVKY